ncbi:MAG: DUF3623 family protein [Planctomycetes bacterium]|nr:DUF3623 family protein [Planctomycetota bacterium]
MLHGSNHPARLRAAVTAWVLCTGALVVILACGRAPRAAEASFVIDETPLQLADTGLYADIATQTIASGVLAFEPQYPLWSDGSSKRRWMRLPAGTAIDATNPDRFVFPIGTRLWKEFAFERRVETRMLTRATDGQWRFATYVWNADQSGATLAPEKGVRGACESAPGVPFDIPARADCVACHTAGPDVVLGFNALQLSEDRDPLAPHARPLPDGALTLSELVRRGIVVHLPEALVETPPRIAAASERERAVLGYLNTNCGICHSIRNPIPGLDLDLSYSLAATEAETPAAISTTVDRPSRFRWPTDTTPLRIARAEPDLSVLTRRMASRQPLSQMPPLGTHLRDDVALELVTAWMHSDLDPECCGGTLTSILPSTHNQKTRKP